MTKFLCTLLVSMTIGFTFSQEKFLTLEDNLLHFKVKLDNLSASESQDAVNILKSDLLNKNFELIDSTTLVFDRLLTDQTNLNTVKRLLNSTVMSFHITVNFDRLDEINEILIPNQAQSFRFLISDINNQTDATSLINFMLNENRFHLVDIDINTHYMTIVTDINFEYDLIKDILKSKGKTIFQSSDIQKYY